jgi:hypothetical protein
MTPEDREELAQVVRAELVKIFDLQSLLGGPSTPLEENFLAYVSAVAKEHTMLSVTPAIQKAVDAALANTFDIYKTVHQLDDVRIRKTLAEMLNGAARVVEPNPRAKQGVAKQKDRG